MESLNKVAEELAYKLGDQFNQTLRESLKETIIDLRAKFIRNDLNRNFLSDIHFSQVITLQFEEVNLLTEFGADFSCIAGICPNVTEQEEYTILRSKNLVPLPVRTKSSGRSPYLYLGRVDGTVNFTYTTLDKFPYIRTAKYGIKTVYYTIINQRLYIINNLSVCDINDTLRICNVMLKGIFEDPREAYKACSNRTLFMDDRPFPISADMMSDISKTILSGEYIQKPTDGEQVNIKPDDTD